MYTNNIKNPLKYSVFMNINRVQCKMSSRKYNKLINKLGLQKSQRKRRFQCFIGFWYPKISQGIQSYLSYREIIMLLRILLK